MAEKPKDIFDRLRLRDPLYQGLATLLAILAMGVSAFVAYDIYSRSRSTVGLQITEDWVTALIPPYAQDATLPLQVLVDGQPARMPRLFYCSLQNVGRASISPDDFVVPLQVSVPLPWKLLAVSAPTYMPPDLSLHWTQTTTNTFEAEPLLLNEGDYTSMALYLDYAGDESDPPPPQLSWRVRVVGLQSLTVLPLGTVRAAPWPQRLFAVPLIIWTGAKTLGVAVLTAIILTLTLAVARRCGRLPPSIAKDMVLLLGGCFLSFSSAHTLLGLLPPTYVRPWVGAWILLFAHLALLTYLAWPRLGPRLQDLASRFKGPGA